MHQTLVEIIFTYMYNIANSSTVVLCECPLRWGAPYNCESGHQERNHGVSERVATTRRVTVETDRCISVKMATNYGPLYFCENGH